MNTTTGKALIDAQGMPRFGLLGNAIERVNRDAYCHRTPLGRKASALGQWLGYKQFQYFGVIAGDLLFGCALAHLRHTAIAFLYLYQPGRGLLMEATRRVPLGLGVQLTDQTRSGRSHFSSGDLQVELVHEMTRKSLSVNLGQQLVVSAHFDEEGPRQGAFEPMGLCTRVGRNGWVYARKVAGVACGGQIRLGSESFDLKALGACAHHDFSAGYMRRETFWNWACFSGRLGDDLVGLNLSCGVNETGVSENAAWLNGQLHALPQCQFNYDWTEPLKPWRVFSGDGRVDLHFEPRGQHKERLNLWLLAGDFKQLFGQFRGHILLETGRRLEINGLWGFVEDQYAKW